MNESFPQRSASYSFRNANTFILPIVHTVKYSTEKVRYRGQRIWRSLPLEIKDDNSVQQFNNTIKFWNTKTVTVEFATTTYLGLAFYSYIHLSF